MTRYCVNTIYPAFMGEVNVHGIGCPCTFVRLTGCNLRCYKSTKGVLCDTPEALDVLRGGKMMGPEQVAVACDALHNKVVCLTGGEPLLQNVTELLVELVDRGHKVVIETNGSVLIRKYRHIRNVSFVVDYKSPSSGESDKMVETNYDELDEDDFIKFVVDTEEDYLAFKEWVENHRSILRKTNIAVGTFWGSKIGYQELLKKLQADKINAYINMQTHKMACLYDKYKEAEDFSKIFIPKEL